MSESVTYKFKKLTNEQVKRFVDAQIFDFDDNKDEKQVETVAYDITTNNDFLNLKITFKYKNDEESIMYLEFPKAIFTQLTGEVIDDLADFDNHMRFMENFN